LDEDIDNPNLEAGSFGEISRKISYQATTDQIDTNQEVGDLKQLIQEGISPSPLGEVRWNGFNEFSKKIEGELTSQSEGKDVNNTPHLFRG
jgi:hypothetical protein